ncbi:hypothetical protein E8E13_003248 [Curvularia kusanoi]|uniref:Uncharacterized protein n=1 Tax=Curvularia kusanoi TaxID=90978 RepID=A0A9P4TCU8_CURKU|nr:hypothetical protein E8E13_003248 [Curvularia kusanoi]
MAHHLIDFEKSCDQICDTTLPMSKLDTSDDAVVLVEAFPDGSLRNRPVHKKLVEDYIEMDFKENQTKSLPVAPFGSSIKMLHSSPAKHAQVGQLLPLAISKSWFRRLATWLRVPIVFPSVLENTIAMCIEAEPLIPESISQTREQASKEHLSNSRLTLSLTLSDILVAFILQSMPSGTWSSCFAASFTYSFPQRCMYIFLQTEAGNSESVLHAIDMSRFASKDHTPFLIPSAIVKHHLEVRVEALSDKKEDIWQLECKMGVRRDHPVIANPLTVDLEDTTRQINALNANLAWTLHSCRRTEEILNFMDSMVSRYATQAAANNVSATEIADVKRIMQNSHTYLHSWNRGVADRVDYLTKRLQALSQSVYSSIAQRDSANSIRIAEAGTKLAETSHHIALATSRDSAVMRVITAVTVVFLPATFTATFFSTTFFNFGAGDNGRVYSSWLWLYFVLTLALTAIVMGGTWVMSRAKEKELTRKMDGGRIL